MANSSLRDDSCSYQEKLRRSVGPGMYMLGTPANDCSPCGQDVPADPYLRWQNWGPGFCASGSAVDDGSELLGLNYKNSKCNKDAYAPGKYSTKGVCHAPDVHKNPRMCMAPTEDTRLSNPPCTLKCTGWNRWEWLCYDPQERAIIPFEWNVSNRIVVKDNHVPVLPEPMDQSALLPPPTNANPSSQIAAWKPPQNCGVHGPGNPFTYSWNTTNEMNHM